MIGPAPPGVVADSVLFIVVGVVIVSEGVGKLVPDRPRNDDENEGEGENSSME